MTAPHYHVSIRLDAETYSQLTRLADATTRSKANMIKWLINKAAQQLQPCRNHDDSWTYRLPENWG